VPRCTNAKIHNESRELLPTLFNSTRLVKYLLFKV